MDIIKALEFLWQLLGYFQYFLLLLIVSCYTFWFSFSPGHASKFKGWWFYGYMQCGISPNGFFISSCSSMCYKWFLSSLCKASMIIPILISQVCMSQAKLHESLSLMPLFYLVTVVQLGGFSFCNVFTTAPFLLALSSLIVRLIMGVTLLILPVIQTLKQSIQIYRASKQWQPNRYIQQFMKDGIVYFFMYVSPHFIIDLHSLLFSWISWLN